MSSGSIVCESQATKRHLTFSQSSASPTVPMDGRTPASRQRWPKASEVYCPSSRGGRNTGFVNGA